MGYAPIILELCIVLCICLYFLNKYGNWRKQPTAVTLTTFVGWYFSFIIIFVLPLDVVITFYRRCLLEKERISNATATSTGPASNVTMECEPPIGYVSNDDLLSMWRIVYWTAQILTWLVLPLMQSYFTAGDFTAVGKFKTALINNAIYYGLYLAVFVLLIIYAILKEVVINSEHLMVIVVSASNTWGLLLLVGLLGYGLVEVPRQLWYAGRRDYRLNKLYFKIDQKSTEKNDAEDAFRDAYKEARSVLNVLKNDHRMREKAQIVVSKFSDSSIAQLFPSRSGADFASLSDADPSLCSSERYLIRLNQRVIEVVHDYHRTSSQWAMLMEEAMFMEDVEISSLTGHLKSSSSSTIVRLLPRRAQFYWHVVLQRPLAKMTGVVFAAMTLLIIVSECTFFIVDPTISPAALLLENAARKFHYTYTQVVSMCLLMYICGCAYSTLFRLRIYKYYHLDPHHLTDDNSLLFSAILLCRLTPPICLNLLGLIHLDSHITHQKNYGVETQFTKLMGHLDLLPILARGINVYLPFLILLACALTYYKLGTYLLHTIGVEQFIDSDDVTMDAVSSGKALVQLERSGRERRERPEDREKRDRGRGERNVPLWRNDHERTPFVEEEETEYDQQSHAMSGFTRGGASLGPSSLGVAPRSWNDHPSPNNIFDDM